MVLQAIACRSDRESEGFAKGNALVCRLLRDGKRRIIVIDRNGTAENVLFFKK